MFCLLFALLGLAGDRVLDLERLGFYSGSSFSGFAHDGFLYFTSETDALVVKMTLAGEEVARYDVQGQGPLELDVPQLVGVTEKHVVVVNRRNAFLLLTHDLKPAAVQWQPPPFRLAGGYNLDTKRFVFMPLHAQPAGALVVCALDDAGDLIPMKSFLKAPRDFTQPREYKAVKVDNGVAFVYQPYLDILNMMGVDAYVIHAYDISDTTGDTLEMRLSADFDGLDVDRSKTLIQNVAQTAEGYHLVIAKKGPDGRFSIFFHDRFDKQGGFLGRKKLPYAARLISIQHSKLDLLLNVDDMKAVLLD